MSANDQYSLNWSNHTNHIKKAFDSLWSGNQFVDVTLSCEGKKISAHKMLLSACSIYFHDLFRDNPCQHPIVILKDVKFHNLVNILKFIYSGEVSVATECFDEFLKTAELLQISGLVDEETRNNLSEKGNERVKPTKSNQQTEVQKQLHVKDTSVELVKQKESQRKRPSEVTNINDVSEKKMKDNEVDVEIKQENITEDDNYVDIKDPLDLEEEHSESAEGELMQPGEMPRGPRKFLGTRTYANYSSDKLEECLQAVRLGDLTTRAASVRYGIPRSTLWNKLKGKHTSKIGRSRVFSDEEELSFKQHLMKLCDYGFPVIELDFRMAVKSYLDQKGLLINQFNNNLPGYQWTKSFLDRHDNLSYRLRKNIKKVRAQIGVEEIENYMESLKEVVDNISPSRIWNYDEINLANDPGSKKIVSKRGTKYVQNISNFSKNFASIMFCGNATGHCLPPYVVYRAENMSTWTENGPQGAHYNCSKNGWFDYVCFEDWFESLFLPEIDGDTDQPTVLIGDNLSSHISKHVLQLCERHNVRLVCLPPNSTHLTQPLDVAFFDPTKKLWRDILIKWKESGSGSKFSTIPKDMFPTLLKELMKGLQDNKENNLKAGFEKCGIHPLNKQKLLDRLFKNQTEVDTDAVGKSFLEQLEKKRADYLTPDGPKKIKIQVPAGKSLTAKDGANKTSELKESTSSTSKMGSVSNKRKRRCSSSSDGDDIEIMLDSDGISEAFSESEEESGEESNKQNSSNKQVNFKDYAI